MKNRNILLLIALIFSLEGYAQRFYSDDYLLLDSVIGGIYGTAEDYQSDHQNLLFDFYEPANDILTERPLIIYLHGGGFNSGSRTYPSVKLLCRRMANKGYAVANIDYRLDPNFDIYDSSSDRRAMTDAMHDAKQAIRYFKANATAYRIDTSLVFIGGESAGAATAMMASFVNKQSEMAIYPMANPNDPIGSSVNSGIGNTVNGTLCLCGLILDTTAIEFPSDPPILWIHGTKDDFVPIALSFNIVLRASNIGLPIQAKAYQGGVHCPWYFGNPNWAIYLDSLVNEITDFLYPKVSSLTDVKESHTAKDLSIYPNPVQSNLTIDLRDLDMSHAETSIKIVSSKGQTVFEQSYFPIGETIALDLGNSEPGIFFLLLENGSKRTVKKLVKGW